MRHSPERRALLTGQFAQTQALRPPGALESGLFEEACSHCGDCAAACPQAIITADNAGFPVVDMSARACEFCNACSDVCTAGAILPANGWEVRAVAAESCLSLQGVMCRTCEDHCDEGAIRFRLMTGGRSQPNIDVDACSGCGACVAPCPADALSLHHPAPEVGAEDETSPASLTQASEMPKCTISADA
ncbi:ferredoxin-type protein NapF [Shimia sp.]|uniref:ferredoxin-type protein NapF n=1 Tax=Shimia sp. TaxID=1954381 RepID=UPI003BABDA6E